jgi:hypothetical protein
MKLSLLIQLENINQVQLGILGQEHQLHEQQVQVILSEKIYLIM